MNGVVQDKDYLYAAFVFLIWPFLALLTAFYNYRKPWAKNILWAFIAYYGFTLAIGAESQGSDITRYIREYQMLYGVPMSLADAVAYFQESGEIDILRTLIAITLSRFTESQMALTLTYGIIFGYFFSRNMFYVLERLKGNLQPITVLLIICFFLIIPIWNLGGFRMWTAAHIFFFGLAPYLCEGNRKRLWFAFGAILVHYSFIVPAGILLFYLLLGNRLTLFFGFYIVTFLISEIDIAAFNTLIENYAPEILQERTDSYRSETQVEGYREGWGTDRNWYAIWYQSALNWTVMGFLALLFLTGREFFNTHRQWAGLFSFTLLFYGVANIFSSLPSGGRFLTVANLFAVALIILYVQNHPHENYMKRFIPLSMPALLLYIIVTFRTMLYTFSASTIMGNPVIALFTAGEALSLNDVMRMLL